MSVGLVHRPVHPSTTTLSSGATECFELTFVMTEEDPNVYHGSVKYLVEQGEV